MKHFVNVELWSKCFGTCERDPYEKSLSFIVLSFFLFRIKELGGVHLPHAFQMHSTDFDNHTAPFVFKNTIPLSPWDTSDIQQLGTIHHVVIYNNKSNVSMSCVREIGDQRFFFLLPRWSCLKFFYKVYLVAVQHKCRVHPPDNKWCFDLPIWMWSIWGESSGLGVWWIMDAVDVVVIDPVVVVVVAAHVLLQ